MSDAHQSVIDLSYLNEYTDGEPEILNELIEAFRETATEEISNLKTALAENDLSKWHTAAHTLKGAAGFVGAEEMKLICSRAQELQAMEVNTNHAYITKIQQNYDAVEDALKEIT